MNPDTDSVWSRIAAASAAIAIGAMILADILGAAHEAGAL